jgi:hypothetical protein
MTIPYELSLKQEKLKTKIAYVRYSACFNVILRQIGNEQISISGSLKEVIQNVVQPNFVATFIIG